MYFKFFKLLLVSSLYTTISNGQIKQYIQLLPEFAQDPVPMGIMDIETSAQFEPMADISADKIELYRGMLMTFAKKLTGVLSDIKFQNLQEIRFGSQAHGDFLIATLDDAEMVETEESDDKPIVRLEKRLKAQLRKRQVLIEAIIESDELRNQLSWLVRPTDADARAYADIISDDVIKERPDAALVMVEDMVSIIEQHALLRDGSIDYPRLEYLRGEFEKNIKTVKDNHEALAIVLIAQREYLEQDYRGNRRKLNEYHYYIIPQIISQTSAELINRGHFFNNRFRFDVGGRVLVVDPVREGSIRDQSIKVSWEDSP